MFSYSTFDDGLYLRSLGKIFEHLELVLISSLNLYLLTEVDGPCKLKEGDVVCKDRVRPERPSRTPHTPVRAVRISSLPIFDEASFARVS